MFAKLICAVFGHTHNGGRFNGSEYGKLHNWDSAPDGSGRVHVEFRAECPRCERVVRVGQFHRPHIVSELWARVDRENARLMDVPAGAGAPVAEAARMRRDDLTVRGDIVGVPTPFETLSPSTQRYARDTGVIPVGYAEPRPLPPAPPACCIDPERRMSYDCGACSAKQQWESRGNRWAGR